MPRPNHWRPGVRSPEARCARSRAPPPSAVCRFSGTPCRRQSRRIPVRLGLRQRVDSARAGDRVSRCILRAWARSATKPWQPGRLSRGVGDAVATQLAGAAALADARTNMTSRNTVFMIGGAPARTRRPEYGCTLAVRFLPDLKRHSMPATAKGRFPRTLATVMAGLLSIVGCGHDDSTKTRRSETTHV